MKMPTSAAVMMEDVYKRQALVCTATMVIRIPTPGTNGYIHPGDALVILSGIFLGPVQGLLAAGSGSALADFRGGYLLLSLIHIFMRKAH